MPVVSRQQCAHCGHEQEVMDHQVFFNDHEFVPLAHPAETYELQKLGVKEEDALLQGRVYWRNHYVCLDCRSISTKRKLRLPDYFRKWQGRTEQLTNWSVVIVAVVVLLFLKLPMYYLVPAAILLVIALDFIISAIAKRRARGCARQLEGRLRAQGNVHEDGACHHCGGARLVDYLRFVSEHQHDNEGRGEALRCPVCDQVQLYLDYKYLVMA